ncbi:15771_t:CDS:1, partial [Funneliformis caledonium]
RRSEALRNLQEKVPRLRVPNYIDIIDNNENREPEIPASRNAQIDALMTLEEN